MTAAQDPDRHTEASESLDDERDMPIKPTAERAKAVIRRARMEASERGHDVIESGHMLLALLDDAETVQRVFGPLGVSVAAVRERVLEMIGEPTGRTSQPRRSDEVLTFRHAAWNELCLLKPEEDQARWKAAILDARAKGRPVDYRATDPPDGQIEPEHLLLGLMIADSAIDAVLTANGASHKVVQERARALLDQDAE